MKFLLDGGGKFDRKQVGHVLEIKRNLISIVLLDKDGCSVKVENVSMKVTKGSVLFIKELSLNGIYVLKGCTIKSQINVAIEETRNAAMICRIE